MTFLEYEKKDVLLKLTYSPDRSLLVHLKFDPIVFE